MACSSPSSGLPAALTKATTTAACCPWPSKKLKALICLGVDNEKLKRQLSSAVVPHVEETQSIETAVRRAAELAAPGDVVLLSPACASFDLFKNYEDRGGNLPPPWKIRIERRSEE